MDPFETIARFIRSRFQSPQKGEKIISKILPTTVSPEDQTPLITPEKWNYYAFREYLLALTRGDQFLLAKDKYPTEIVLNDGWHQTLNTIRQLTRDGKERWSLIGFKDDKRSLYLPVIPVLGLSHSVPTEVTKTAIEKARINAGITNLLGDIHSHPFNGIYQPAAFSATDLYNFVATYNDRIVKVVVDGPDTIFAFKTQEFLDYEPQDYDFDTESFIKHWYPQFGLEYRGKGPKESGGEKYHPLSPKANPWQLNVGVAHQYGLVLYKCIPGQSLRKINIH